MAWPTRRRSSHPLRPLVRSGACAAIAAAIVVPLCRKRLRLPAGVTIAASAAGPLGLAVLRPRTKARDAALYAIQMWGFTMVHELPYDKPDRLERRLRIDYPIRADRIIGLGELPNSRLQRLLSRPGRVTVLDRFLTWIHWLWFFEPHLALFWILVRHNERLPRAARQVAAAFDLGCVAYFAVPTSPPWWAAEQGRTPTPVRRVMVEVGEETWGQTWQRMYDALGGNPWAAMPSLHFAASVMAALLLSEAGPAEGAAGWGYAGALGFALVYLGEHYVIDLLGGLALVAAVRRGEPLAEPVVVRVNSVLQRLERIANS